MDAISILYEKYLTSDMHESDLIIELDSLQKKNVRENGVIYTPWHIVKEMILIAAPNPEMKIIEPSCGHGIFIIGLLYYMNEKYNLSHNELLKWFINKVDCVEISEDSVIEFKNILSKYFLKHFNLNIDLKDLKNIYCQDGLLFNNNINYDLCIGNPPYIRAKNMSNEYLNYLKSNFASCKKGTVDIYFAFIEKYMSNKKLVFITPNSFITSKTGEVLRGLISDKLSLLIDFKDKKIFKDASVYTCIFKIEDAKISSEIIYGNDLNKTIKLNKTDLFKEKQKIHIESVLSGIATLCDNVFLVKKINEKYFANNNGINYEIEKEIVVPYLKLTKIKNNLSNIDYMIYPYDINKKIISEELFKNNFPLAYDYLIKSKDKLSQRDKGKTDKYENWYAYGRKQGLHHIKERTILAIPKMIGGECKPKIINIEELLKIFGKIVFTSGYIIEIKEDNKDIAEYILSNNFIDYLKNNGKVWSGKFEPYYSLTATQVKNININNC